MNTRIAYRPEVDGLRSIAILSVLFYHAEFLILGNNPVPGGYLGVDVFFVISGYLITSIILKDLESGHFSFIDFYERRARRILPVLLSVMLVSLPFAWRYLLPQSMIDFSHQILSSIFFSSNVYFWSEDPYWASASELKPFLHTWSLAIEEQFYLVMPLLLIAVYRYGKFRLLLFLSSLALASIIFAQWSSSRSPDFSFYWLPTRMWELFAGTVLAVHEKSYGRTVNHKSQYLPSLGLILILCSIIIFNRNTSHPSFITALPILGTMLIIRYANAKDVASKILSSSAFVAIGLISYGLYLWHFPILAFSKGILGDLSNNIKLLILFSTFLLAFLSYVFIEKPFRNKFIINRHYFFTSISVLTGLIISFTLIGSISGFSTRFPDFLNQALRPEFLPNHTWFLSDQDSNQRIILVGDSHMQTMAPELLNLATSNNYNFAASSFRGCQFLLNAIRVNKKNLQTTKCAPPLQNRRMDFIASAEPSFVVIGGRLPLILEEDRFDNEEGKYEGEMADFFQNNTLTLRTKQDRHFFIQQQYQETVSAILEHGHTVVLVYPIPEVAWHVPNTLVQRINGDYLNSEKILKSNPLTTSYDVFQRRTKSSYDLLDAIKGDHIIRIYPETLFCNTEITGRCITHNAHEIFYRDDNHLSQRGSEILAQLIIERLKDAINTSN